MAFGRNPLAASGRLILALATGALGGFLFWIADLPLPWMLGSITATTIAALAQVPVGTPRWVRPPLSAIIGAMLGAAFPSDVIQNASEWVLPLAGLLAYMLAAGAACVWYFRNICGFDIRTAYFCGMPGGLIEMALLGEAMGADVRRIALIHSARVLLVVFIISGAMRFFLQSDRAPVDAVLDIHRLSDFSVETALWLTATCIAGLFVARTVRLPAGFLLGPMIISAVLHIYNVTNFHIPVELAAAAQVGLGATIGCRFLGQRFCETGHVLFLCLGSTVILLSLTILFAGLVHRVTGVEFAALVLTYSPGGLAEMGIVALALNLDAAFVACHHLVRVAAVGFSAGPILQVFDKKKS